MREVRTIMPKAAIGHNAVTMSQMHGALVKLLVAEYGGATVTDGEGFWTDPTSGVVEREPVLVYDVAIPDTADAWERFCTAVVLTAGHMRQKTVYVRDGHGRVFILPAKKG